MRPCAYLLARLFQDAVTTKLPTTCHPDPAKRERDLLLLLSWDLKAGEQIPGFVRNDMLGEKVGIFLKIV